MKWILNPFSGFLNAIGIGNEGGGDAPNADSARKVVDQNNEVVVKGTDKELIISDRIVFPNNAGVRIGYQSGKGIISAELDSNISIGDQAGNNPTSSSTGANVNIGTQARKSSNGFYNVAFGFTAGRFSTGNNNAMFGQGSASYLIGSHNVIFGSSAGYYAQGSYNVYLGFGAGGKSVRRPAESYTLRIGAVTSIAGNDGAEDLIVGDMQNYHTSFRGDIEIKSKDVNTISGLILTSPNNSKYRLTVNDDGGLSTELV